MSEEIEEPLSSLPDEQKSQVILVSSKEISSQDVLICGQCHHVSFFPEQFAEHKTAGCTENAELKDAQEEKKNEGMKKPQIWAFTLWKNTKFRDVKDEEKPPTAWSIYQMWCNLDTGEKNSWLRAAENVQALHDIVTKFQNVRVKSKRETLESEDQDDKGEDSDEDSMDSVDPKTKKVLKPVQLNNKKPKVYTFKATRAGSDPNVEYQVEKIISKRYHPRKKTFEFLVKWDNFDSEKNTWEAIANLHNCKPMLDEFEKNLAIQKAQLKLQKTLEKKRMKQQEVLNMGEGRPQRTSKQKALNQVKAWCGNMEDADENSSGKRVFSDDSDDDDSFEKRMKYEAYSSDSELDSPVVTIKRISKNGVEKKPITKVEGMNLPDNILIPDAKGIVRINQKQIPSLSSGVYVMSKTAGIIKLDTKASKLATSGGQTVLKVAPKIGQTSIKVIKKEITNGSTPAKTANMLRAKPVIRNYSSRVYLQKRAMNAKKAAAATVESAPDKFDDESDGVEELEFPAEINVPAPDSPPEFTLCPLTGKVLDKDGKVIEEPKSEETEALDNLVKQAAADILKDLTEGDDKTEEEKTDAPPTSVVIKKEVVEEEEEEDGVKESNEAIAAAVSESTPGKLEVQPATVSTANVSQTHTDSILSTALTNANIVRKVMNKTSSSPQLTRVHRPPIQRINATPQSQSIITRITPGQSAVQRSRVMAPKAREPQIIRKRIIQGQQGHQMAQQHILQQQQAAAAAAQQRAQTHVVKRTAEAKVYPPSATTTYVVNAGVATLGGSVINMPSLLEAEKAEEQLREIEKPAEMQMVETSGDGQVSLNTITMTESETPLLITGEDGTIYQVAGQNEDGQTILITQGEDGEQQCLLVAPENAGLINQALMKTEPDAEEMDGDSVAVLQQQQMLAASPNATMTMEEQMAAEADDAADDSQVVAQIVSANPPSPGGSRKVVLMLPDGNFMMTEVTAEQYAALELDK